MEKIAALLTAKGNSTLEKKNTRLVVGHPVCYYPAYAATKSSLIHQFFVSSDSEEILDIANNVGYTKIVRPDYLSQAATQHLDVINHALSIMDMKHNYIPDILVVLLGNSVTIKSEWIDDCISYILNDSSISAIVPVVKDMEHHPYRAKKIDENGFLQTYFDFSNKNISTNRQDLEDNYFLCHNFWVLNIEKSIKSNNGQMPWAFMGDKVKPYIIQDAFDIHNNNDFILSENWVKTNLK